MPSSSGERFIKTTIEIKIRMLESALLKAEGKDLTDDLISRIDELQGLLEFLKGVI